MNAPHWADGLTSPAPAEPATLDVVRLADVSRETVSWLWRGWLAAGKLHVFDGDPGQGKSTVTLDIAARLTTGRPMPGESARRSPADVVLVTYEDGLADTIRPRLEAAGADLTRVHAWRGHRDGDVTIPPTLPDDFASLRALVSDVRPAALVIDPLMAALAGEVNSYRDQDVRRVLAVLSKLAEEFACAVLLVRHLRKGAGGNAIASGGGSIGIIGAARIGWMLAPNPEAPEARVLAQVKNNLAPLAPSWGLALEDTAHGAARAAWGAAVLVSADELHAAREDRTDATADLDDWLRAVLAAGPVPSKDLKRLATDEGHAWRTVQRRAKALGVVMARSGFGAALTSTWGLPSPIRATEPHSRHVFDSGTNGANGANGAESPPNRLELDLGEDAA